MNRSQVRDCCAFMAKFVPVIISIMMDNIKVEWGDVVYPVITDEGASTSVGPAKPPGKSGDTV